MEKSLVGARYRAKPERIAEALTDLQLAMRGLGPQAGDERPASAQGIASFARLCSVFLRKLVLGDRSGRDSRLLDKTVMSDLKFSFQPVRRIPRDHRRTITTGWTIGGGVLKLIKIDDPGPGPLPTHHLPILAQELTFVITWPLPGTADWIQPPSDRAPWTLGAEQLFDTGSTRDMNCEEWLGQQVVKFDEGAISLREIIQTVVNLEGAHAVSVDRLAEIADDSSPRDARRAQLDLLSNITVFGIRYLHLIVIEAALYLYENLLRESSLQHPDGGTYLVKPAFRCPVKQATSPTPNWIGFEGTMRMAFLGTPRASRHAIGPTG